MKRGIQLGCPKDKCNRPNKKELIAAATTGREISFKVPL
jgi:hypothetical protein